MEHGDVDEQVQDTAGMEPLDEEDSLLKARAFHSLQQHCQTLRLVLLNVPADGMSICSIICGFLKMCHHLGKTLQRRRS
jgi:hypothetical protein